MKKLFYMFGLVAVAVLLGAGGCQKQSATVPATDSVDGQTMTEEKSEAVIIEGEEAVADTDVTMEAEGETKTDGETITENKAVEGALEGAVMGDGDKVVESGEAKAFTLEAGMFYFSPNAITVNKGDKVKITLKNVSGTHDFVIDEFNARTSQTKAGETATVEFTADKTGSFEYYCSVGNHRQQGMVGTLTVK